MALGSTSSAIVIPMVRFLSVSDRTRTVLTLESALNDILVIVLSLVVLEMAAQGQVSGEQALVSLVPVTLASGLVGVAAGLGLAFAKWNLPPFSGIKFSKEVSVCVLYGLSGLLGLNGAIAVLCLGLTLGNLTSFPSFLRRYFKADSAFGQGEMELLAELAFLLKVFFFLYLGLLIRWESPVILGIALLITLVIFLTRYGVTRLCVAPAEGKLDALAIFAMGPRGLAAAVVAGLPLARGLAEGAQVQSIVFATIPFTILTTAILVFAAERFAVRLPLFRNYRGGNDIPRP